MSQLTATTAPADRQLAKGLGWLSIALGLSELAAPRQLGRNLGTGRPRLLQAYGLRELVTGIGILGSADRAGWIWGRVAGDVLDIASLLPALRRANPGRHKAAAGLATVLLVTAADIYCARQLGTQPRRSRIAPDYSDRSGFPRAPEQMRGAAVPATAPG